MRIAMGIEYDGSQFHGWQSQCEGIRTIQREVEFALSKVANHPISVICAGRTDALVHGMGQVIHFDTTSKRTKRNWLMGVNAYLPNDVNIIWVSFVNNDFHARFSAISRKYQYLILNKKTRSSLMCNRATWIHQDLEINLMQDAEKKIEGEHDFSSYRASGCQAKSPIRKMHSIKIKKRNNFVILQFHANAFLQHMVRNITGVLIEIGKKEKQVGWAREVLEYHERARGGITASPEGLYFEHVEYPPEHDLPCGHGDFPFSLDDW